jgi:D-3-phosphoglycerate dehydrogenase
VPGVEGGLAGIEPISPAVIAAADRLRIISRNGTGVDNLPMPLLEARGIRVTRAAAANATGVAELTLGLMLCACRELHHVSQGVRQGDWPRLKGREIEGATVGIFGAGAIGRKLASVLVSMGAKVIAYDPLTPDLGALSGLVCYVEIEELLEQAEILTLHCPMPADGRPVLNAAALGRMRDGAIILNTARSGLVDEEALRAALDAGRIAAYGTDVFAVEPPPPGSLAAHPRVIATSHIGGLTGASVQRATRAAVDNLLNYLVKQADAVC